MTRHLMHAACGVQLQCCPKLYGRYLWLLPVCASFTVVGACMLPRGRFSAPSRDARLHARAGREAEEEPCRCTHTCNEAAAQRRPALTAAQTQSSAMDAGNAGVMLVIGLHAQ